MLEVRRKQDTDLGNGLLIGPRHHQTLPQCVKLLQYGGLVSRQGTNLGLGGGQGVAPCLEALLLKPCIIRLPHLLRCPPIKVRPRQATVC